MRNRSDHTPWLEQWADWFERVGCHLKIDPTRLPPLHLLPGLIRTVERDAIAGELLTQQLPPGKGRDAARRVVRKLDALNVRLTDVLVDTRASFSEPLGPRLIGNKPRNGTMSDQDKAGQDDNRAHTDVDDVPVSGASPAQSDIVQQPERRNGPTPSHSGTPDQPGGAGESPAGADEDTHD